jgi:hypothetical protein
VFRKREQSAKIREIRLRNRFVMIMRVYEQVAEFLLGLKKTRVFDDMMLEHEPVIKMIYERVEELGDAMLAVFDSEKKFEYIDLASNDEETEES